jgi:hypothetical protein
MKTPNISPANYRQIMANVTGEPGGLQESRLQAFFRLIQARGHVITNEAGVLLYGGAKALKISETEYVAIERTAFGRGFYPCKMKFILLTELTKPQENDN